MGMPILFTAKLTFLEALRSSFTVLPIPLGSISTFFAIRLAKEIFGVDLNEKCVAKNISRGYGVLRLNLDFEKLPFADESIDLVTTFDIIEHL